MLAAAVLTGATLACGNDAEPVAEDGITREQFIEAVVAIRDAEHVVEDLDSADVRFRALRDSIMDAQGITDADLEAFLVEHQELTVMNEIWDTITQRLKRPMELRGAAER